MAELDYSFTTTVDFSEPVRDHAFVLRCLPTTRDNQSVMGTVSLAPDVPFSLQTDSFGNTIVVGRIDAEHQSFTYHSTGTATVSMPRSRESTDIGAEHPRYRFPSPLARITPEMITWLNNNDISKEASCRSNADSTHALAEQLTHLLHDALDYQPGSTNVETTASEAFAQGRGVCQDFAHIMIAMLRYLGLPARYASGFTVGEGATHAWAQTFIGGLWLGFDPTRNCVCDDTYLVCSVGRDWSDCPVERGVFIGNANQTQTVFMEVSAK